MVQSEIKWAADFTEASGGRYNMQVYAGGVLGGMVETFDMMRTGGIEMADISPDYIGGKDLVFVAQGLPWCTNNAQAAIKFVESLRQTMWQQRLRDNYNVEMLACARVADHDGWSGTKPIHTLEDWKGTTIWISGPTEAAAMTALGASTVSLDWNDGYPAIEKGVVDGSINGFFPTWMLKWDAVKYVTMSGAFISTACVGMTYSLFKDMPADLQAVMTQMGKDHQARVTEYFLNVQEQAISELKAQGVEIYYLPDAEKARWQAATANVANEYYAKLDPADAATIKALFAEANK